MTSRKYKAKGSFWKRVWSSMFLLPAWFSPHKRIRVFFHRLRGVDIGKNVEVGYYCIIGNIHPSMIHIEDNAVVAANSIILEHDNAYYYTCDGPVEYGDVYIRKGSFIGIGSVILPGVEIGKGSIVGAVSLVKDSIPPYCVAAGRPAKLLKPVCRTNMDSSLKPSPGQDNQASPDIESTKAPVSKKSEFVEYRFQ